ncbi:1-aminocyclopropane-1-carboxylate deaminase [Pseudoalteromonas citrea]|uniref:1-aminocyclopropane-1-carboxylate deaminase n=1 Tax=Pseudoalteromonas citrea TaxID=43655 RepID=A0A5S3XP31_9GAMM|nr:pyridoxal-phosphate dependent enzyme [Pseudoalteromonas citrea]TMP45601.1 1-aminocyclopropane-1-carboxylate deaminase [Pseudoalteromonas citrea]TMP58981.1 1-aminocyclopropane-1-carboxylate deaminase [Pseudoalteromonas citrea]
MRSLQFDWPESPMQRIDSPSINKQKLTVCVKRDDLLHPTISGNKWRKLKYNLKDMHDNNKNAFVTFSGAFSNHLYASSMAAKLHNIEGHVILRGPHIDEQNPTIKMARACKMNLHVVNRITYRQRNNTDYQDKIREQLPNCYLIPEGGSNQAALKGVQELAQSLPDSDYILCPTGSGGTLAGLIDGSAETSQILGIAVLKNAEYLNQDILGLSAKATTQKNWQLLAQYHDGGYGKFTPELWLFCQKMRSAYNLPLEPIYSGKAFYALWQLIDQGYFPAHSKITFVHTGGLQGLDGLRYRKLI